MSVPSSSTDSLHELGNPLGHGFNNEKVFYTHGINGICLHATENLLSC